MTGQKTKSFSKNFIDKKIGEFLDDVEIDLICKKISFSLTNLELLEMDTFILGITLKKLCTESHLDFCKLKALPDK